MTIGVLALQGDFDAHRKILEGCAGVSRVVPVRSAEELNGCDGLSSRRRKHGHESPVRPLWPVGAIEYSH
jgi:hypothetical protein